MNSRLYEKLFLINCIPTILGNGEIQDIIKQFAYLGEIQMEKAKQFQQKFKKVLHLIQHIHSKKRIYADNLITWTVYTRKFLNGRLIFESDICKRCGDYTFTTMKSNVYRVLLPKKFYQKNIQNVNVYPDKEYKNYCIYNIQ